MYSQLLQGPVAQERGTQPVCGRASRDGTGHISEVDPTAARANAASHTRQPFNPLPKLQRESETECFSSPAPAAEVDAAPLLHEPVDD